jgi:preprotein translocase subunit SecE
MVKERGAQASFVSELFQSGLYKRNQGRVARQVTFAVLAVMVALGAWSMSVTWVAEVSALRYGVPAATLVVGLWISYRLVNVSKFADFLIAVEGEMAKVSWPGRSELIRSTIVVIFTIMFLAAILFMYDVVWQWLLKALGVLRRS